MTDRTNWELADFRELIKELEELSLQSPPEDPLFDSAARFGWRVFQDRLRVKLGA